MTRHSDAGDGDPATATDDVRGLVAWLKQVTPEWPPVGVDWPLVLAYAERMLSGMAAADGEQPREGQTLAAFIGGYLDTEMTDAEPAFRVFAFASLLLDAFSLLEAFCTASLVLGYDRDAPEQPVGKLTPFHGLMCLGMTMVEWIRSLRDAAEADVEARADVAPEPVQVGAAFGRNAHQAVWNLADEICGLSDSVTEGRLDAWGLAGQPPGAIEDAWWKLSEALVARLPDALEAKEARVRLESESRTALASARPPGAEPGPPESAADSPGGSSGGPKAGRTGNPARRAVENSAAPAEESANDAAPGAPAGVRVGKKPHGHKLQFEPGGFVFRTVRVALSGKPLLVLEALANARGNALSMKDRRASVLGQGFLERRRGRPIRSESRPGRRTAGAQGRQGEMRGRLRPRRERGPRREPHGLAAPAAVARSSHNFPTTFPRRFHARPTGVPRSLGSLDRRSEPALPPPAHKAAAGRRRRTTGVGAADGSIRMRPSTTEQQPHAGRTATDRRPPALREQPAPQRRRRGRRRRLHPGVRLPPADCRR